MNEQMEFPETFEKFSKVYGFKDDKEVYTNGSELIPVFRVEQWLEHILTPKNDLGVDCISRQAVLEYIESSEAELGHSSENELVCQDIKELLLVTPQPKTGHWVYKIYGGFHEQGNWYCSHCDYQFNYGKGHAKHCPECGYEMSEPSTEEVIGDKNYDWVIRR